eukprot:TRINITY_DN442_c0_g1_i2.p1 TRINITY_DN442_c0_g1~~TRINITY_DN442_c0_g1_i2.p1  ORF type:complete len:204 (+),score=24.96 TRINITY_DN442_c0_g1_i2:97-708(+)
MSVLSSEDEPPLHAPDFGEGIYFSLNKNIELRYHPDLSVGKGLFATKDIPEDTLVWYDAAKGDDELITVDQMEDWKYTNPHKFAYMCRYAYQVDRNHLRVGDVDQDASFFTNHSCDPNTWYLEGDSRVMVARRLILKGEEITYDYATSETLYLDFESCSCGTSKCRGKVTQDDWKLPKLKKRYGNRFTPYILEAQRGVFPGVY